MAADPVRVPDAPRNFYPGARRTWHQARRHAAVTRLLGPLRGATALDWGCGWGDITALVAPRFDRIIGFDASEPRVAWARAHRPHLEFRTNTGDTLDWPSESVDVVFSIVVLPFVGDVRAHLTEAVRVLRPQGHLVLMYPNPASMAQLMYRAVGREFVRSANIPTVAYVPDILRGLGMQLEAATGLYDPPDRFRGVADSVLAVLNVLGHLAGWDERASYVGSRWRRVS